MKDDSILINQDNNKVIAKHVRTAQSFFFRLCGLLGTACLPAQQGLLIRPCNSVHTIGMRYAIDVLFLSNELEVVKAVENLPPFRISACLASAMVLELPAGTIGRTEIKAGGRLAWK